MKLDKIANSGNDEFYTPTYAIEPLLKYIRPNAVIWCPFDTERSVFVRELRNRGHRVIATHLFNGVDFFETTVPECDYIISNPPYSCKGEVFKRLFELDKPFAMLVGVVGLFESAERFNLFKDNSFEMMYLSKRVAYFKDYDSEADLSIAPPFSSVYICKDILPFTMMFEEIVKPSKRKKVV